MTHFDLERLSEILEGVHFGFDPTKNIGHEDARRKIEEHNRENDSWQKFQIKSSAKALANHYHTRNNEEFFFISGKGKVYTAPVDENGNITGPVTTWDVEPGVKISIPVLHTHRFDVEEGAVFICHSSRPFNPADKDLNTCRIILPGE